MSIDTVNDLPPRVQYIASASQTVFPYPFPIFQAADLVVEVDGAVKTLTTHYTVSGAGDDLGGNVTFLTGQSAGAVVTIYRQTVIERDSDFQLNGPMFSTSVNDEFDKLIVIAQELRAGIKRAIRLPNSAEVADASIELTPPSAWKNVALLFDANGAPTPGVLSASTMTQSIIGQLLQPQTAQELAAGVTPQNYAYPEGHLFRYLTTAQRTDYLNGALTLDLATPIQQMINVMATRIAYLPKGTARINSALTLPAATTLRGEGVLTRLTVFGSDAINITGDFASVQNLQIHSVSAVGAADPKTHIGIHAGGANGAQRNSLLFRDIYLRGFLRCFDLPWTWTTTLDHCETGFCFIGVRLFGQSTNNHITNCHFECNGAGYCIYLQMDGVIRGEGLFVASTFMAAATSAILSNGFYSLAVDGSSMADLISGIAFDLTNTEAFVCLAMWVYSADSCFKFRDGGAIDLAATIRVGHAWCHGASSTLFSTETNQAGINIIGGVFNKSGATAGYPIFLGAGSVSVIGTRIINASGNPGIYVGGSNTTIQGTLGATVQWAVSPIASVASASTVTLPAPRAEQIQIVTVTGTTTINNINDVASWAGKTVVLKFSDTVAVIDGAVLKLNGNFSATVDDTLTLISDGAAWYEVARSAN